jgi:hypothetical protein
MHNMINNLMTLNKVIIFVENMIDDDINPEFFSLKINSDLDFVNSRVNDFWDEYLKDTEAYKKENFIKTYTFVLKRFYTLMKKFEKNMIFPGSYKIDETLVDFYLNNIQEKLGMLNNYNTRSRIVNTKKQCINEEEYSILFEKILDD